MNEHTISDKNPHYVIEAAEVAISMGIPFQYKWLAEEGSDEDDEGTDCLIFECKEDRDQIEVTMLKEAAED